MTDISTTLKQLYNANTVAVVPGAVGMLWAGH